MTDKQVYVWYTIGFTYGRLGVAEKAPNFPTDSTSQMVSLMLGLADGKQAKDPQAVAEVIKEVQRLGGT